MRFIIVWMVFLTIAVVARDQLRANFDATLLIAFLMVNGYAIFHDYQEYEYRSKNTPTKPPEPR